ncbi:UNVERIFIED_CONTAM: hypothetical protein Sradi_2296400 [Sesamum radiatum]|uniref:RNase H type-1 domain-containing protein n=1 Tax=Sesamum radiatum TaxID=300843 RepID=A0AAW2T3P7_SESRA
MSRKRHLVDVASEDEMASQGPKKIGYRGPWTVQVLGTIVRTNNPLVFLAETKCDSRRIENLKRKLDMYGFCVPAQGKSGGLAVLWGSPFTWTNRHPHPHTVHERLDRACVSQGWSQLFPDASVTHLHVNCSDHKALLVRLEDTPIFSSHRSRPWRFEAAWLHSDQCEQIVAKSWGRCLGPSTLEGVAAHIAACRADLSLWSKTVLKADKGNKNRLETELQRLSEGPRSSEVVERCAQLRHELERIAAHEETLWRQRRLWVDNEKDIQQCIVDHFAHVYASNCPRQADIAKGTEHLRPVVDASMARELTMPYTETEVAHALFQMAPLKSPGPDAFVPGRLISDNILLAFEINHFLNTKSKGKQGWMAMKLDVSKAYDKVEWSFLEQITRLFSVGPLGRVLELLRISWRCTDVHQAKKSIFRSPRWLLVEIQGRICTNIVAELNIRRENKMELYLGLPSRVARSKRDLFAIIRDKVWSKITGWNEKLLSQAGKEILIKSIIQAVPTYAMACFRLPISLKEIQSMVADFWWSNQGHNKIHWISWQRMCESKLLGGLGFRHLHLFNLAMLAKQLWRIWSYPEKLLSRVLKARYFPRSDVFRIVGDPPVVYPITPAPVVPANLFVADLVTPDGLDWDVVRVRELFWPEDSEVILGLPLSRTREPDLLVWHYSKNGRFSVRSAYHLACLLDDRPGSSSRLGMRVHGGVRRIQGFQAGCPLCCAEKEDVMHVLALCPFARQAWGLSSFRSCLLVSGSGDTLKWMQGVALGLDSQELSLFLFLLGVVVVQEPKVDGGNPVRIPIPSRWQAPPSPFIKLNFDGATFNQGKEMGVGVVARDDTGRCVCWLARRILRPGDGEMAESIAVREAVNLALRKGWRSVVFEGDCATLILKLQSPMKDCSFTAHFFAKCAVNFVEGDHIVPPAAVPLVQLDSMME